MGVTTDTAITATTIGITTTTIIIVTGLGLPLSTVAPATTATIETSPLFEIALVHVRFDLVASIIVKEGASRWSGLGKRARSHRS